MKKIFLLLTVGILSLTSCNNDDDFVNTTPVGDGDTVGETFDLNNVNLTFDPNTGRYAYLTIFDRPIVSSDVVLVYRRYMDDGFNVWQSIPRTIYFDNGDELDYDFNFSVNDVLIYATGNFDVGFAPGFTQNQQFRIVIVPSDFVSGVDVNNYNEVARKMNTKESEVIKK
ncbi:MAG: hypothetical protein EOO45_18680 [Flavobacterium sp.]|nr:MAG: hypothetical protein EOO45_18680 [Flavobacterium sp.]